jgi:hypothetical protein
MKTMGASILLFSLLLALYGGAWRLAHEEREKILTDPMMDYTLPSKIIKPMSLRFKGLVSDFLFLKTTTFIGERIGRDAGLQDAHKEYIIASVDVMTDLDPYFWDPYHFAFMLLAWDFGDMDAAREIMEKAIQYRDRDWRPPYYIGFGCFHFQKNMPCATKYLARAALFPGVPEHITLLASRLHVYANTHRPALVFLKQSLMETENPGTRLRLEKRILALERLDLLEGAVRRFHAEYQRLPETLHELTEKGILDAIPEDPYGGEFYILENGRVFTSSALRDGP